MSNPLIESALEILRATRDGDELAPEHLALLQGAVNGHLNEKGEAAFQQLVENVQSGYKPPWFHGMEHLTIDHEGYVSWRGKRVEHFEPDYAYTEKAKQEAEELAERCCQLEAEGKPVNKFNVVLNWTDRVKQQPVGAGRGDSCDKAQTRKDSYTRLQGVTRVRAARTTPSPRQY